MTIFVRISTDICRTMKKASARNTKTHYMNNNIVHISLESCVHNLTDRLKDIAFTPTIPTGFKVIDGAAGGLKGYQVIILAARACVGKTALMLNMAMNISRDAAIPTAFISPGRSANELVTAILNQQGVLDPSKFRDLSKLCLEDLKTLIDIAPSMDSIPLYIDDTPDPSPDELRASITEMAKAKGVKAVFVDDMQMCDIPHSAKWKEKNSVLIKMFRELADNLGITIVAASGLRSIGIRRPAFRDLERAGFPYHGLNDYVDIAAVLHRKDWGGTSEIVVLHNRHGRRGVSLELMFDSELYSFRDIDVTPEEDE